MFELMCMKIISILLSKMFTYLTLTIPQLVLQVDKAFTASCESKVTPLTIAVFLKYCSGKFLPQLVLPVDKAFTASCELKVTPLTITVFLKYCSGKFLNLY